MPLDRAAWRSSTDWVATGRAGSVRRRAVQPVIRGAVGRSLGGPWEAVQAARAARRALVRQGLGHADPRALGTHASIAAIREADHLALAGAGIALGRAVVAAARAADQGDNQGGRDPELLHPPSLPVLDALL